MGMFDYQVREGVYANKRRTQFHLACIGLTVAPEGTWICESCTRRANNNKKGSRGGKRRGGNGRTALFLCLPFCYLERGERVRVVQLGVVDKP